ncbi:MAG: hypothetical protein COB93_10385, partial [Sneathiella sp.]
GSIEISSDNLSALPQWQRVVESFDAATKEAKKCDAKIEDCRSQQMTLWRAKINELGRSAQQVQMQEINRFFNSWRHRSDVENYGTDDHWATPLEFVANGGDSEDFAIMKYLSLKELGFRPENMRIVVANDVLRDSPHTVLSVSLRGRRYILDSINDTILRAEFVQYYVPLYSVNETWRWAHIPQSFIAVAYVPEGVKTDD